MSEEDLENALLQHLEKFKERVAKELQDVVFTACDSYAEYAHYEPLENWKLRMREELMNAQPWRSDDFWGKKMRSAILADHKSELIPLLQTTYTEELEAEIKRLKSWLDRRL